MYNVAQQGVLQAESSPTDLAISGGGFFVVNSSSAGGTSGAITYTRAGNFSVDANGNLVNAAGFYLQGQPLTNAQAAQVQAGNYNVLTTTTPSLLQTVNVSNNAGTAQQTGNVSLIANLPASGSTPQTMTVPVYDSLGVQHDMTLSFTPSGTANTWTVGASFTGAGTSTATIAAGDNTIKFNTDGTLNAAGTTFDTAGALSIAWDPSVTGGTSPQTVNFNLGNDGTSSGLSQIGTAFTVGQINQDGVQFGNFSGVTVNSGRYRHGELRQWPDPPDLHPPGQHLLEPQRAGAGERQRLRGNHDLGRGRAPRGRYGCGGRDRALIAGRSRPSISRRNSAT